MISQTEKEAIAQLIEEAEINTDSELVPMIVNKSHNYPAAHFRCAIVVSFIFSLILYFSPLSIINPIYFLLIQIPGLLVGYLLASISFIARIFITKEEIDTEVNQRAIEAFYDHNLHYTDRHNGVLIFISLFERKIKIITDVAVKQKIEVTQWDLIISQFSAHAKSENYVEALKSVITTSSKLLEAHFPKTDKTKKNELQNEIIFE